MNVAVTSPVAPAEETTAKQSAGASWIYGPVRDFLFIHGAAGLVALPVAVIAFAAPQMWMPLFFGYSILLGLPHVSATHVRLQLDEDCRQRFAWLYWLAPILIAGILCLIVFPCQQLPNLIFAYFLAQTWHANRQNFGIMRRYMRMYGSDPRLPVNRVAEAGVEIIPWAAVSTCLCWPASQYLGYPIKVPTLEWLLPVCVGLWAVSACIVLLYVVLEICECSQRRFVPGRILCFWTGAFVNIMAWVYTREVSWGYLVVSTWHALQYISYVHAFRSAPPPGARVKTMSLLPHLSLLLLVGYFIHLLFKGLDVWIPAVVVIVHLSINFHHYLSDALIWRAPKLKLQVQ